MKSGYEVLFMIPLVILGIMISIELSPWFESIVFGGDFRVWLFDTFNTNYDQRNSIVVGFAMGFAVIPIIFTICEDALSSVPQHLTSASLALGATKWQTVLHVVLPAAMPGILTGVLLGVGKAIGETAVVWLTAGSGLEAFIPRGLSSPTGSLPMYIYLLATQAHTVEGLQRAFGASLVLLVMFLVVSVTALMARNYYLRRLGN